MKIEIEHDIEDSVWVIHNNKIKKTNVKKISLVRERENDHSAVVNTINYILGHATGIVYKLYEVFSTKEALIESLMDKNDSV